MVETHSPQKQPAIEKYREYGHEKFIYFCIACVFNAGVLFIRCAMQPETEFSRHLFSIDPWQKISYNLSYEGGEKVDKGIDQNVILQAIHELSDQIKSVEKNLSERMSALESRMGALESRMEALETRTASLEEGQKEIKEQVRKIDKKLDILNRDLLDTRADVEFLKK
ncbi:hypothetical protein HMPREF3213_01613 [Heyndrickxia coagulans]|uniref:Uncharacterized protein n=1 Tax=Heyndrickxia coagulans TaxID=1398 RepID=A0A133KTA8_HEYCO|nr:hypothetical protein HMPREF3213_01613 [Heyndrickxia coagulans]